MTVTDNPGAGDMNAALANLTTRGYSVTFERAAGAGVFADLCGPSGMFVTTCIGATPAEALAGIWPPDDDGQGDAPARCAECGALVGHFDGRPGLQHWRVIRRVVDTFDAGHAAALAAPAAGAQ
jgi:hypothetical protein